MKGLRIGCKNGITLILITIGSQFSRAQNFGTEFFTLNRPSIHRHPAHPREIQARGHKLRHKEETIHRHAVLVR